MPRVAIGIEYDGSAFVGWQAQADGPSIQAAVEWAVSRVAAAPTRIHGAGRTDAGVHAAGQVAHFDTPAARTPRQWVLGLNSNLPDAVAVTWATAVPDDFDARRSALWREYRYVIVNQPLRSPLERQRAWWVREPLDAAAMTQAAAGWLGEHDFSALRAAHCQSHSPMRCLLGIGVSRVGPTRLELMFRANAFLYHMVRNMVGTLVDVGTGRLTVAAAAALLASRDRTQAGATAPAAGLTLAAIAYDARFGLPHSGPLA